jgi:hypothetical protein
MSAFIGQNAAGIGNVYGSARRILADFLSFEERGCRQCLQFRARPSGGKL